MFIRLLLVLGKVIGIVKLADIMVIGPDPGQQGIRAYAFSGGPARLPTIRL